MYQKDYILRMIEMLGELIAAILGFIRKGKFKEAEKSLDNLYFSILKEDASFFYNISKEKLTEKLIKEHNYTNNHLEVLAELFYAEGELRLAKKKENESREFFEKSLILFQFIENKTKSFSFERQSRVNIINEKLKMINQT